MASQLMVPGTVAVVVLTTEASRISQNQNPTMKPVISGFVLGVFLYGITAMDVRLGKTFCLLVTTGAILKNGLPVLNVLNGR